MEVVGFIGPPGAGKDTQAEILATMAQHIKAISIGELLRKEAHSNSYLRELIKKGLLVPDSIILKLMRQAVKMYKKDYSTLIITGVPRTVTQAEWICNSDSFRQVIFFRLSEEEAIQRLTNRLVCPTCGKIYHPVLNPPKHDTLCDLDGTPLVRREDDKPGAIKQRFHTYKRTMQDVLRRLEECTKLKEIDAGKSIPEVTQQLKVLLGL